MGVFYIEGGGEGGSFILCRCCYRHVRSLAGGMGGGGGGGRKGGSGIKFKTVGIKLSSIL